jgi:hypothetical protein
MQASEVLKAISKDPRYISGLDWGIPRAGHPEGVVYKHIEQLKSNLSLVRDLIPNQHIEPLELLIQTHDTFKSLVNAKDSVDGLQEHAKKAAEILEQYEADADIIAIARYHDIPYGCWADYAFRNINTTNKLATALLHIKDVNLFCTFVLLDGTSEGKSSLPLDWTVEYLTKHKKLEDYVFKIYEKLKSNCRDQREEFRSLAPLVSQREQWGVNYKTLGPTKCWGADLYLPASAQNSFLETLQEVSKMIQFKFTGIISNEDNLIHYQMMRLPEDNETEIPAISLYRQAYKKLITNLTSARITIFTTDENCTPVVGGIVSGTICSDRLALLTIQDKLVVPMTVQQGTFLSISPNKPIQESHCFKLTGQGKEARKNLFDVALALSKTPFYYQYPAAGEMIRVDFQ